MRRGTRVTFVIQATFQADKERATVRRKWEGLGEGCWGCERERRHKPGATIGSSSRCGGREGGRELQLACTASYIPYTALKIAGVSFTYLAA